MALGLAIPRWISRTERYGGMRNMSPHTSGLTTVTVFLRIFSLENRTNCSIETDFFGTDISSGFKTVVQPFLDRETNTEYADFQNGENCSHRARWKVPVGELAALATSDNASIVVTWQKSDATLSFYTFVGSWSPLPTPVRFQLQLPPDYPVDLGDGDIHLTFTDDGNHLAMGVAGLGVYYVNMLSQPPAPVLVYGTDNPCGVMSLAIDVNVTTKTMYLVAAFNQLIYVAPDSMECMLGGDGLLAFKI